VVVDPAVPDVVDGEAGDVGRLPGGRDPGKVAGLCAAEAGLDAHGRAIAEDPRRGPLEVRNRPEDGDSELPQGVVAFEARLERHVLEDTVPGEAGHNPLDVAGGKHWPPDAATGRGGESKDGRQRCRGATGRGTR
jgi:hypothetical protein